MNIKCAIDFDINKQEEVIKNLQVDEALLIGLFEEKFNKMTYEERKRFIAKNDIASFPQ